MALALPCKLTIPQKGGSPVFWQKFGARLEERQKCALDKNVLKSSGSFLHSISLVRLDHGHYSVTSTQSFICELGDPGGEGVSSFRPGL